MSEAENGEQARWHLDNGSIDLAILDIMLPDEDGLSIGRYILAQHTMPIIFLTAKGEDIDRILGLELGADDYMSKPFNPRELLARIRAVLRRNQVVDEPVGELNEATIWQFSGWELNGDKQELTHSCGAKVALSRGEYSLLAVMLNRAQAVLNRDQLLDMTQGRFAEAFDRSVDNQISRLRKKLDCCDQQGSDIVRTVWGRGYRLAAEVSKK